MAIVKTPKNRVPISALDDLLKLKDTFDSFREDYLNEDEIGNYREKILEFAKDFQLFAAKETDLMLGFFQLDREDDYELVQPLYTAVICETLASTKGMNVDDRLSIIAAALTHDIGMHTLRDVLKYQVAPLSPDQLADLKLHPLRSVKLLRNAGVRDRVWLDSVQQHHERMDGSGYPHGISIEDISAGAKMIAIADIYTAMTKPHGHRNGTLAKNALSELFINRGDKIDNELTQLFIKEMGLFPPGAVVRLMNGDVALVTHRGKNTIHPVVQSIVGPRGAPLPKPIPRNTSHEAFGIRDMVPDEEYRKIAKDFLMSLWTHKKIHFSSGG